MFARRMQQFAVGMVALLVIVGGAGAADGPATNVDLHAQESLVWTKTILDTYNATIVDKEAPWHDDARQLIQVYIRHLVDVYPGAQPVPTLAKAERMGRDLLAAGCDSPIVQIIYGRILFAQGLVGEAQPYLLSGYQAAHGTPNLQLLLSTTAIRLAQCSEAMGQSDEAGKYHAEAVTALVAVAGNTMYLEDDQSALLEILVNYCLNELSLTSQGELVRRAVAEEGSGEWLCKMLAGLWHFAQVREGGSRSWSPAAASWASSIDPYLRPGSSPADSAAMARRLFTAAWELRPERPRAAAAMVMLSAYRQSNSFNYETWFRRAIKAQLDYGPVHQAYIRRVEIDSPWQVEQMLQTYGRSRLAGDYETLEPYYYFLAVTTAVRSPNRNSYGGYYGQSSGPTLTSAAVKRNFKTLLKGYDDADLSGELLTHVNLMSAAVSCLEKDWPRARKYLDAVDDLPGRMGQAKWLFDRLELNADLQIAQVYAKTGPTADALGEAMKLYGQGDYDGTLAILYDTADAHRDDYWTTQYLHYSIRYTLTTRDWMAGLWVDITPSADLMGWRTTRGQAWVDATGRVVSLIGTYTSRESGWSVLTCDRGFQDAYEIRCRLAFPSGSHDIFAGPIIGVADGFYQQYYSTALSTAGTFSLLRSGYAQYETGPLAVRDVNTIYTQVWKQRVRTFVNGSETMDEKYVDGLPSGRAASTAKIAIGGRAAYSSARRSNPAYRPATFGDIQIRRLTAMPPSGAFDTSYRPAIRISTYSPAYGDPRIGPLETHGQPSAPNAEQDAPTDGDGPDAPTTENTETPADDDDVDARIKLLKVVNVGDVGAGVDIAIVKNDADDDDDMDDDDDDPDAPAESEDDATPDDADDDGADDDGASLDKIIEILSSDVMADVTIDDLTAILELEDGTIIELAGDLDPQELAALFTLMKGMSPDDPAAAIEQLEQLLEDEQLSEVVRQLAEQVLELLEVELLEQAQAAETQADQPAEADTPAPDETPAATPDDAPDADDSAADQTARLTNNQPIRLGDAAPVVAAAEVADAEEAQQVWACSMHPQAQLAEAGDCPTCGMALIAIEIDQADAPEADAPAEVEADAEVPAEAEPADTPADDDDEPAAADVPAEPAVPVATEVAPATEPAEQEADDQEDDGEEPEETRWLTRSITVVQYDDDGNPAGFIKITGDPEPLTALTDLLEDTDRDPDSMVKRLVAIIEDEAMGDDVKQLARQYLAAMGEPYQGDEQAEPTGEWADARATQPVASATGSLFHTELLGGEDGEAFEDALRSQGYLIGLRLRFADGTINSIQPIYRTPGGRRYGGRVGLGAGHRVDVVARKGYAVGSLTASGADQPGGLQVAFMRVTPTGQLDPADGYTSQWYGPGSGGSPTSTDGRLPVGLAGRMAGSLQAIGLIATDTPFLAGLDIPTGDLGPAQAPTPSPRRDMVDLDGHYYMLLKSRLTWDQANQHCQAMGGQLVQIDSKAEDELIAAMWRKTYTGGRARPLWIGARPNESGQWAWASGDELTYTGWLVGHPEAYPSTPNSQQEDQPRPREAAAVGVSTTTRWINMAASNPSRYICEWDHEPTDDELSVRPPTAPATAAPRATIDVGDVIPFNGHWYKAFYDVATWYDAKAHCESLGGHLIYVNDAEENSFAEMFVLNTGLPMLWIGATDEAEAGEWFWLDGTAMDYNNWGYGEPNVLGNEHAAALIYRPDISGWNNLPGATELVYMCEWDYDPTAPAQPEGEAADE